MSFDRQSAGPPAYPPPAGRPPRGDGWSPGRFSPAILLVAVIVVAILVGAAVLSRRNAGTGATPTASAGGPPVAASSSAATSPGGASSGAQPSVAPAVSAVPGAATPATERIFIVGNTDGDGVYLRRTPKMADRDTPYPDGTRLVTIGPDVTGEGELWHHVRTPDGKTGYVPAKYTVAPPR